VIIKDDDDATCCYLLIFFRTLACFPFTKFFRVLDFIPCDSFFLIASSVFACFHGINKYLSAIVCLLAYICCSVDSA